METSLQKKDRVLARSQELIQTARRGDTPEEILAKGAALAELKRMRPWRYEGEGGGFRAFARRHLPYRAARANQYIRIAQGIPLEEVAGTRLCFEVLLVLAKAPAGRRAELLAAAAAGASAAELRGRARDEQRPSAAEPQARLLRLLGQARAEVERLRGLGVALPPEVLRQIEEVAATAGAARVAPTPPAVPAPAEEPARSPLAGEAAVDPRGSTVAAEPEVAAPAPIAPAVALQLPAEVRAFVPLFRFFHEELSPERQGLVQRMLVSIVRGTDGVACMREVHYAVRPYLAKRDPRKPELRRLSAALRAEGLAGRRFALYCLLAARLPELEEWLGELREEALPEGLRELCAYYHGLLTRVLLC